MKRKITKENISQDPRSLDWTQVSIYIPKEIWREILVRALSEPYSSDRLLKEKFPNFGETEGEDEGLLKCLACVSKSFSELINEFVPAAFKCYEDVSAWVLSKCLDVEKIDFRKFHGRNFHEDLLTKYTNLQQLAHPNYLEDFTGQSLKNLPHLKKLDLRQCYGVSAETLSNLTCLESLDIRVNAADYFEAIKNLSCLKSLKIDSDTVFLDSNNLTQLTSITSLTFSITLFPTFTFSRMPQLRTFIISGDELTFGLRFSELSHDITTLVMKNSSVYISDAELIMFSNLTSLSLRSGNISSAGIQSLTKLSYLDISECPVIGDEGIIGLHGLTELHVNLRITNEGLKNLPNLTRLELKRKPLKFKRKKSVIQYYAMSLTEKSNANISNEGLSYLKNLKYLSYDATRKHSIDEQILKQIFPNLEIDSRPYQEVHQY